MTMTPTENPHEQLARLRRAITLADLLDAIGWTPDDCASATPEMWALAAAMCAIHKPSASTCELVTDLLRQRARAHAQVANAREIHGPAWAT